MSCAARSASTCSPSASSAAQDFFRERPRDPRRLGDARDAHLERERRVRRLHRAGDRRGGAKMRRRGERNVPFAGEQAGGRIEPDPAGARNEHLGPGVQVRAVALRPGAVRHVGLQLNQIARHEARRQAEMAQRLHHQPRAVAARAFAGFERFLRRARAGLHAGEVAHRAQHLAVQLDQELHGADRAARRRGEEGAQPGPERLEVEIAAELVREVGRKRERIVRRIGLDEEVERIDHRELGMQVDRDAELAGLLREGHARDPVAVRVMLPVHVMAGRHDFQRIARRARAPVRRRAQADHLRPERDRPVVGDSA